MAALPKQVAPIERLGRIQSEHAEVVSCYVRLDPISRQRQRYLVDVKRRVRTLEQHLAATESDRTVRLSASANLAAVVAWLADSSRLPRAPGVALFVAERLGLFTVVPLARVHRNRVGIGRVPLLHQLLDAQETLGHYLAILIDRTHTRFFDVSAAGTEELPGLAPRARRGGKFHSDRADAPGWGERDYHQRLKTEAHRHYALVAETIGRLTASRGYAGIALLGTSEQAEGLAGFLPRTVLRAVLGVARLNPTAATKDDVAQATWLLQGRREKQDEAGLIAKIEEGTPTGWATNGARETLRALSHGQVGILVVPESQAGGGYRCGTSHRLVLAKADCRGEGPPEPVVDLVDAAIDEALRQRAEVVVIDDPDLAKGIDGMGAILRFRSR